MVTGIKSDYVVNLVNWPQTADDLVLHYELRLQTLPEGWERLRLSSQPQLKSLIASAPDTGIDNLFIAPEALRPFVSSCPHVLQRWRLPLMRREFLLSKLGEEPLVRTSEESKELLIEAMRYHLMPAPPLSRWLIEMQTPMHDLLEPYDPLLNTALTRRSSLLMSPSISLSWLQSTALVRTTIIKNPPNNIWA
ncbi:uncharacterized protein LOC144113596 [Amblyomma americanum]